MRRAFTLAFVLFLTPQLGFGLSFQLAGTKVADKTEAELEKMAPPVDIKVYEPHELKELTYHGVPFNAVLDAVYHDDWKQRDEILFTCTDGYQPSVPVAKFLKHKAYLVYRAEGRPNFDLTNLAQDKEHITLAPFYLVWDNLKSKELRDDGMNDWPYKIAAVDLIRFTERFPHMAPPDNASAAAKRGFLRFRENCLACHSVNGEGGKKGIELNYPASVTEYFAKGWLRKWIVDPPSVRYGTRMPPFNHLPGGEKSIDDILKYLEAMAKHKIKPNG